ncbi:MAG: response regulator transcription factor [Oscillospiraceae bacterium]|nr:response regulator transcription factor [Oscillospiraceae bacterium]
MKPIIFVVEDDKALQELYAYSLEGEFMCRCFNNGTELFSALNRMTPDLILIDVLLPGDECISILSRLKVERRTAHIPVVTVSLKGDEPTAFRGLSAGADDYIAKPFGVLEFLSRIRENLRKNAKTADVKITYKDITIDYTKRRIIANGNLVKVTLKEFKLLCLLCKNAEKVQGREQIFLNVWGNSFAGETRTIDMHIKELRKKLAGSGCSAEIKTIHGVGYMLI